MGTASLKAKLIQKLMYLRGGGVLYEIFLDLHKAYSALDQA